MTKDEAISAFKNFCLSSQSEDEELEEVEWYDMSIGYFLALGLDVETSIEAAIECRYTHQYWC